MTELARNTRLKTTPLEVQTLDQLLEEEYPTESIIDEGILDQEGMLLIEGPTEAGKSYFALLMALVLALGQSFLGRWTVERPFRVLLVQAEIGRRRFQERSASLARAFDNPGCNLRLATHYRLKLDTDEGWRQLDAVVREHSIEVLILDPMRPFHEGDENSSQDMERLFGNLKALQAEHGVAIVLTHHERKPSVLSKSDKYAARGSSLITDRPDTVIRLDKVKVGPTRTITFEKLRNAPDSGRPGKFELQQDSNGMFVLLTPDPEATKIKTGEALEMIPEEGSVQMGELKVTLAVAFEVSEKTAEHKLNDMERDGFIRKFADPANKSRRLVERITREGE